MSKEKVLITGITGQLGSYMAELLIEKGYEVHGLVRRTSFSNTSRLEDILSNITLHEGEITDYNSVAGIFNKVVPNQIVQAAAMSHVGSSFDQPSSTFQINTIGHSNILKAFKEITPNAKLLFTATSELFGTSYDTDDCDQKYQGIETPFIPNSPYAISKLASFHMTRMYRDAYKLKCCSTIANNHESCRRGENFVTRKITKYIGELVRACSKTSDGYIIPCSYNDASLLNFRKLKLGNINAVRDWSFAGCVARAYWMILQGDCQKDYVIGSGEAHSVKDFLQEAFSLVGLDWRLFVEIDPKEMRAGEVPYLRSDSSEIRKDLGWKNEMNFKQLVKHMVMWDIDNG